VRKSSAQRFGSAHIKLISDLGIDACPPRGFRMQSRGPEVWICSKITGKYGCERYLGCCQRCKWYRRLILSLLQKVERQVDYIQGNDTDRFAEYHGKVKM
jgi:hypothetical protein